MIDRMSVGDLPAKHHLAHRGPGGELRWEEAFTRRGFDGAYALLYHAHRPHEHAPASLPDLGVSGRRAPEAAPRGALAKRHFKSQELDRRSGPSLDAFVPLMFNKDVVVSVVHPDAVDPVYQSNADGDDLYFVFEGSGRVRTPFGDLRYGAHDYVCIPRGVVHRFEPDAGVRQTWLSIECLGGMSLLDQWRNPSGQLTMDAPYSHRDFRRPDFQGVVDEGLRGLVVKRHGVSHGFTLPHTPLDVVGWDGAVYPFVFPIANFQPRAGLVHLPPTWHGTFACRGGLICSFVPRVVDFHEQAIPCPYPHSSVDVDEFLFYVEGNFTSRKGVGPGSISFHPAGIPHGPHPGAYEASIGHARTDELAVMLDVFDPFEVTADAVAVEDAGYMASFVE